MKVTYTYIYYVETDTWECRDWAQMSGRWDRKPPPPEHMAKIAVLDAAGAGERGCFISKFGSINKYDDDESDRSSATVVYRLHTEEVSDE